MRRLLLFPERCPPSLVEPAHLDVNQHLHGCEASLIIPQHFVVVLHTRTRSSVRTFSMRDSALSPTPSRLFLLEQRLTRTSSASVSTHHQTYRVQAEMKLLLLLPPLPLLKNMSSLSVKSPQPQNLSPPRSARRTPQRNRLSTTHKSSWFLLLFRSSSPFAKRVMLVLVKRLTLLVGGGASAPRSRKEEGGAWR